MKIKNTMKVWLLYFDKKYTEYPPCSLKTNVVLNYNLNPKYIVSLHTWKKDAGVLNPAMIKNFIPIILVSL